MMPLSLQEQGRRYILKKLHDVVKMLQNQDSIDAKTILTFDLNEKELRNKL